ncbi:MAG: hypothetical protein ACTSR8_05955 [Promethearchaeota archaeon]
MSFLEGEFDLIPNSATLRHNFDGRNDEILNHNSSKEQVDDMLARVFNRFANYVKQETGVDIILT